MNLVSRFGAKGRVRPNCILIGASDSLTQRPGGGSISTQGISTTLDCTLFTHQLN